MKNSMNRAFIVLAALVVCCVTAFADDGNWMMQYYKDPKPDLIAGKLSEMQKQGHLKGNGQPSIAIGFISRVMRDNPGKVLDWLRISEAFPQEDRNTILIASSYSGTKEAKNYFKSQNLGAFANQNPPEAFSVPIESPSALDYYWAIYFASGDPAAIRRIVDALELSEDSGALQKYKSSKQTEADKKAALNDAIFQAAGWSLSSNCQRDETICTIYNGMLKSNQLAKTEQLYLALAYAKAKPDEIKVHLQGNEVKIDFYK